MVLAFTKHLMSLNHVVMFVAEISCWSVGCFCLPTFWRTTRQNILAVRLLDVSVLCISSSSPLYQKLLWAELHFTCCLVRGKMMSRNCWSQFTNLLVVSGFFLILQSITTRYEALLSFAFVGMLFPPVCILLYFLYQVDSIKFLYFQNFWPKEDSPSCFIVQF